MDRQTSSSCCPDSLPWVRVQVLSKTMDSTTLSPEKVELATVTRNESTGEVSKMSAHQQHKTSTGLLLLPLRDGSTSQAHCMLLLSLKLVQLKARKVLLPHTGCRVSARAVAYILLSLLLRCRWCTRYTMMQSCNRCWRL